MNNPLLVVEDLTVSYQEKQEEHIAVKRISFEVMPGEVVALVGESGSGKSSTALALMGLLPQNAKAVSSGILYRNPAGNSELKYDPQSGPGPLRGHEIAMIFQNPSSALNPVRKTGAQVEDVLAHTLRKPKSEVRQLIPGLYQRCGIPDPDAINNSYPHQLSGGQKQRVFIAMATAANPALLIADEPTTALDVTVQAKIIKLLKNLGADSGMSTLIISHDLALVADIADRVLVMRNGEIIESGPTKEIFRNPQKAYTKGLLLCRPPSNKRFERLPVLSDFEAGTAYKPQIENPANRQERLQKMYALEPVIKAENIVAAYQTNTARLFRTEKKIVIHGLNLMLFPGETLGLAGESGSGKTTLGKVLAGLHAADSGNLWFNNQDLSARKSNTASPVQMVFQDPSSSFNPTLTILEALLEPLREPMKGHSAKEKIKVIQSMLEQVQIPASALRKLPAEFSGGQIQRIAIARALLMQPKCVVFDESVSSLDVSVQAGILNLINKLKNQMGLSCVFISHDLSVVRYMSDRVLIMKEGQIVEEGDADSVFTNPSHAYTRELIEAIPQISISN